MNKKMSALLSIAASVLVFIIMLSAFFMNQFSASAKNLMKGVKQRKVNTVGAVNDDFIKSTNNFSIELFKLSVKENKNTLISPTSVYLALGMTANGADKTTAEAFKKVLGKYDMTIDNLNKAYKAYSDDIQKKRKSTVFNISNSIWYSNDFQAKLDFLQRNADYFDARAGKLNFNDKSSVDVINKWVKKSTKGKIEKIVTDIKSDDVMFLINAVYFNGKWKNQFKPDDSMKNDFYMGDGSTKKVMYMNIREKTECISSEDSTGVLLPYDDGRFALLCLLPGKDIKISDYINNLDENSISKLMNSSKVKDVQVSLPKFKVSYETDLNEELKKMGLAEAFDSEKADFSKMGSIKGKNIYVSDVAHKTYFKVDEKGTEAAAVTSVKASGSAAPIKNTIIFNRPFIYSIVDLKTGLPVFLGVMDNPEN